MNSVLRLPPPNLVGDEQALNAWFAGLTPAERGAMLAHTQRLIDALPPQRRRVFEALERRRQRGEPQTSMRYLGAATTQPFDWAGAFSGLAQVGGAIWGASITGDVQKDIAKNQADTAVRIAQIQADAGLSTQALFAGIQGDVAKVTATLDLEKAKARNQMLMVVVPVGLSVVGLGVFLYMRKSKKRSK